MHSPAMQVAHNYGSAKCVHEDLNAEEQVNSSERETTTHGLMMHCAANQSDDALEYC